MSDDKPSGVDRFFACSSWRRGLTEAMRPLEGQLADAEGSHAAGVDRDLLVVVVTALHILRARADAALAEVEPFRPEQLKDGRRKRAKK